MVNIELLSLVGIPIPDLAKILVSLEGGAVPMPIPDLAKNQVSYELKGGVVPRLIPDVATILMTPPDGVGAVLTHTPDLLKM